MILSINPMLKLTIQYVTYSFNVVVLNYIKYFIIIYLCYHAFIFNTIDIVAYLLHAALNCIASALLISIPCTVYYYIGYSLLLCVYIYIYMYIYIRIRMYYVQLYNTYTEC